MSRPRLTKHQKMTIDHDDVDFIGWDAMNRPVVAAWYYAGFLQPRSARRRHKDSGRRVWALRRNGDAADVTLPVEEV